MEQSSTSNPPRHSRLVRLRRPATLSIVEGPFVPRGVDLDAVDENWTQLRREQPHLYDGRLYHVLGVHRNGYGGAVVHLIECAFRFAAVQDAMHDLGVRPLGVKAITRRGERVLMGRRSARVTHYVGHWEFAPGGVAEVDRSPEDMLRQELREETRLTASGEPTASAILHDATSRTWDLVYQLNEVAGDPQPSSEYEHLEWRAPDDWPRPLSPAARLMLPLVSGG